MAAAVTQEDLDQKIGWWVKEYGPGDYGPGRVFNILAALIAHQGFVPNSRGYAAVPLRTWGDDVEQSVRDMADAPAVLRLRLPQMNDPPFRFKPGSANECFRAAHVVRAHHFMSNKPFETRLYVLHRAGISITRYRYLKALDFAHDFMFGYLSAVEGEKHSLRVLHFANKTCEIVHGGDGVSTELTA